MRTAHALASLAALLVSGCAYRQSTLLTNPETMEVGRCDRMEGTPVGAVAVARAAALNSHYDQCIAKLKRAGFLMPPATGSILDTSLQVIAVRGDAGRVGLRVGDRVLQIEGFDLTQPAGRRRLLRASRIQAPREPITVPIERDGAPMEVRMALPKQE